MDTKIKNIVTKETDNQIDLEEYLEYLDRKEDGE